MTRPSKWACIRWIGLGVCLVLLVGLVDESWARVGGGQTFSTGGGSGGHDGSGGGEAEIIFLLIRLAIYYPHIGIPLILLFLAFLVLRWWFGQRGRPRTVRRARQVDSALTRPAASEMGFLNDLERKDPGFSRPVLLDFLQVVHRRATEAAVTKNWVPLAPYVSANAQKGLEAVHEGVGHLDQVVVGTIRLVGLQRRKSQFVLTARFLGSRCETREGQARRVYVEESWRFVRSIDAVSPAPEVMSRMGCPSCGAALETDRMGTCQQCDSPLIAGTVQWSVDSVDLELRRDVQAPHVGFVGGGKEPSYDLPTAAAPQIGRDVRSLQARHPDFDLKSFEQRVDVLYNALQRTWSEQKWDHARPYVTDTLYQTLRFWMEQYSEHGLRNRLDDVRFERMTFVSVRMDAWYEAVTVRIWGSMKDYVVNQQGEVVGGNRSRDRLFSEYWTLLRVVGTGGGCKDPLRCPSCGAPLDRVSQVGVCGYCESKITTGQFDWVLSRIDQIQTGPS